MFFEVLFCYIRKQEASDKFLKEQQDLPIFV